MIRIPPVSQLILRRILPVLTIVSAVMAEDATYSPSQTVVVTAEKSPVMADDKTVATVTSGTILHFATEKGPWLMIPRYRAWIKRTDVLPVEKADEHFSAMLRQKPTAEAFEHRGKVRFQLGRNEDALQDFEEALRLAPDSPSIFVNRGIAAQRAGKTEQALADYTEALKRNPDYAPALQNRGTLLLELQQVEAALVDIEHLLKVDADSPEGHNLRGVCLQLGNDLAGALVEFDRAIELFPKYAEAYDNRAYVRKETGDLDAAVADYEKSLELDPSLVGALNDFAWLLATAGEESRRDPKRAVTLAEKARSLSAEPSADVLDTLAAAYAADARFSDAVSTAEQAAALTPEQDRAEVFERIELYRSEKAFVEP